ncbi:hypothetical protein [Streptomyces sp. NPDC005485]|uniref:hypothetical protein n=1 Tax=Streptomyces sp. NPDC005485 TaxID=3155591 RepID=UPI0033B186D6
MPTAAHAESTKSACVYNPEIGTACITVYHTGTFVSKVFATHEYRSDRLSDHCGGSLNNPSDVYMYFSLTGTLSSGSPYSIRGTGRCDVEGNWAAEGKAEYKTFVANRTFKSGSSLCVRTSYLTPADDGLKRACVGL